MVILSKDFETKEIGILGFRKILKDQTHPDYKELKLYIKNGWIPVDPEDDEKELQKARKRRQLTKENKARRPKYETMQTKIEDLIKEKKLKEKDLTDFKALIEIKNNYKNVLEWYNKLLENKTSDAK